VWADIQRDVARSFNSRLLGLDVSGRDRADAMWDFLEAVATPQVRSVFYNRMYYAGGWERIVYKVGTRVRPGLTCFELNCGRIGPGLVIGHGFGTVVWAESIGSDCLIHQGVTMGYNRDAGLPRLGDRVYVAPGATILGGVTIGDDAVIAANAVVLTDVPAGAIVGGVPARVLSTATTPAAAR
jgi:serine O-acetyltransferase